MRRLLLLVALSPCAALAWDYELTAWRGETVSALLPDYVSTGEPLADIDLKVGVAHEVRYVEGFPGETHYRSFADRVVWGESDEPGPLVVSVAVAETARSGTYRSGDIVIKVLDRVLPPPDKRKYHLDLWQHPWSVARYHKVKPFSTEHYAAMRPLWKMLADAGARMLTVTLLDRPWNHQCYDAYGTMIRHIRRADGSWRFDYSVFDEYVRFGRECGLAPGIACYSMCPWEYVLSWEDESGKPCSVKAVPGSEPYAEYWGDFLVDFQRHLEEKGWLQDAYIAIDERSPDDVRAIAGLLREKAPGLKISLAANQSPSFFKGIKLHHCCFDLRNLTDELLSEADERRRKNLLTTYYVCCGPATPNTFCMSRLEEAFWLGAYPAMCGLDGFLRWAWNSWPKDPMRDASSYGHRWWKAGDTFLVYPDGSPSLRFLELCNGIQAAEKIRILRESEALKEGIRSLSAIYDRHLAMSNACDFAEIRQRTMDFVNHQ